MDVTCSLEDLELYDSRVGVGEATFFTISRTIVWAMGIIAQKTFGNNVFHSGILELSPNEYPWRLWLPYCTFAETNRSYGNTASFLYNVHNTICIVVS